MASTLDWDRIITDTDNDHLEGTIYFWAQQAAEFGDKNVCDYLQYNLTGVACNTATGNVASMQGFFVRVLSQEQPN